MPKHLDELKDTSVVQPHTKAECVDEGWKKDTKSPDSCAGDPDHKSTEPKLRVFDANEELMGLEALVSSVLAFESVS